MNATLPVARGKRACVIGAGFGGLALAIRLQAAGVETVLIEGRDRVGGLAYAWERDGFTFDAGPTTFTDPDGLRALWALAGRTMDDDITLLAVSPFCRLGWPDGATFDFSNDMRALAAEVARIAPGDLGGFEEFQLFAESIRGDLLADLGRAPWRDPGGAVRTVPQLLRHQAWRSIHSLVSSHVKHEKLREVLTFHLLLRGGNPFTASAIHATGHRLAIENGVWWPQGGAGKLAEAMARLFEQLGGTVRLHDPAVRVHTFGDRASEVECQSGWRERFDAVASNADAMHTYRELLGESPRGGEMARRLARKRWSPSLFIVHFGLEGTWPGIPHHTVLFGPRYRGFIEDVFEHGVLPADMALYLHHPSVTDPSVAPPGKSTFYAMLPVAHRGKLPIDWQAIGPMLEKRVLDEVGRRLVPDIHDRIVTKFHYTPRDFVLDLGAYHGSAFGLEPVMSQSAWLRLANRDPRIRNFYLAGASTHPGAGVPAVLLSAQATANLMLEELK